MAATRTLALAFTSLLAAFAAATILPTVPTVTVPKIEHILLISVDGLHQVDVSNFVSKYPTSFMAKLAAKGMSYPGAKIKGLSDSFPGLLSLVTGATSGSTGVWYDDSYATNLYAPSDLTCKTPGAEIVYDESIENDDTKLFSGINPANLPRSTSTGSCQPVYPHSFLKVNTIFEVIKAAGKRTMWSDKHWAYDLVNGPSGKGVDDLFTPEVAAVQPSTDFELVFGNDMLKVQAVINNIQGRDSNNTQDVEIPAIMGLDFQALSVAQKNWGYKDAAGTPSPQVLQALQDVDAALGSFLAALKASGIEDKTAIILTAKHGQSPIDQTTLKKIPTSTVINLIKSKYPNEPAQFTSDTVGVLWLADKKNAAGVAALLTANAATVGATTILSGDSLNAIFTNAATNPDRTPDVIIKSNPGVIYTTGSKIMEHGGLNDDDVKVPIVIKAPFLLNAGTSVSDAVTTTQVAPTILSLLGLDPNQLQGVGLEATATLPGLTFQLPSAQKPDHVSSVIGAISGVLPFGAAAPGAAPAAAPKANPTLQAGAPASRP